MKLWLCIVIQLISYCNFNSYDLLYGRIPTTLGALSASSFYQNSIKTIPYMLVMVPDNWMEFWINCLPFDVINFVPFIPNSYGLLCLIFQHIRSSFKPLLGLSKHFQSVLICGFFVWFIDSKMMSTLSLKSLLILRWCALYFATLKPNLEGLNNYLICHVILVKSPSKSHASRCFELEHN